MTATTFEQANCKFGPPGDMTDTQCGTVSAFKGQSRGGPLDGVEIVVVAWQPTPEDLQRLNDGHPVFLTSVGGLPAHFLSTSFEEAVRS
jgi:hypothetical protein